MKKILTVGLLAIVCIACKKSKDEGTPPPLPPPPPPAPVFNPEGLWAGKVKLTGTTDSVQLSLHLNPGGKTIFTIFKPIPEKYEGTWRVNDHSLKITFNAKDSLTVEAAFDQLNNRFTGTIRKINITQGSFFITKREPLALVGNYVGYFGYREENPNILFTLIVNTDKTIKDNNGLIGTWSSGSDNSFTSRLESPGEVSSGYFYRIFGDFDPATGILYGRWVDNKSDQGRYKVYRQ